MTIRRILYTFGAVTAILLLNSCFSLNQEPEDRVKVNNSFKNPQEARYWMNGIYSSIRAYEQGDPMYLTDLQADFLNLTTAHKVMYRDMHRWKEFRSNNEQTQDIWRDKFAVLANINVAIEGVEQMREVPEVKALKGELYLARAYNYSYLVTHYCKAYDAATAATDLGLPILNYFETKVAPLRSSLQQTYEFILSDITKAETFLADKQGQAGATTFTVDAAKALKARMLLYKGEWAQAYATASELIESTRSIYPLVSSKDDLQAMWANDTDDESITQLYAFIDDNNTTERPNRHNGLYIDAFTDVFSPDNPMPDPNVIPTQDFVDLFDDADWRKEVYIQETDISGDPFGFSPQMAYMVTKYPRNEALAIRNESSPYFHKPKLFRIAEAYLIAAEAAYRNNDETNAKRYLNELRQKRGLTTDVTASGATLFTEIQNERNRELCFEGVRLHDLKRWGLGVRRGTPQDISYITTTPADETYQLNLPANYYKMVWPIPESDIEFESGRWQQNPGW